jgi:FkbM family methyltransferase
MKRKVEPPRLRLRRLVRERIGGYPSRPCFSAILGYRRRGSLVFERIAGLRLVYDLRSVIGQLLIRDGNFEEMEVGVGLRMLSRRPGAVVFDVGANIGFHSLRWARKIPGLQVYAWEPSRRVLRFLHRNVALNRLSHRVMVHQLAASDSEGTSEFYECDDSAYGGIKDTHRRPVIARYQVERTTIDRFVELHGITRMDVLKIDVEGHETEVIRGAFGSIARFRPVILAEIYGGTNSNPDPQGTVEMLLHAGYRAFIFQNGEPRPFIRHTDADFNYLFIPS